MTSELNRYYSYVINGRSREWFLNALGSDDEMAYEYVKQAYGVNPVPGQRVRHNEIDKHGVIARRKSYDNYVYVKFDGEEFAKPCHPCALDYLEYPMPTDDQIIAKQQADIEQIKRDIEHIKRVMKNRGLLEERKDEE
jgi:hypothetical protein